MMAQHVNIGAFQAKFKGRMRVFKRGVLLKLFGAVIKDTPVLTGRLRANWQFSKGQPLQGTIAGISDPTSQVNSKILTDVGEGDENYYLANNLPYAHRIEYEGWSHTKAPEGMVRKNMVRIANILREEAKRQ